MDLTYEAGTLTANHDDRTVTGLLVPYGEVCKSNLGRFSVDSGVFTVPRDVSVLNANVDHDHEQPTARFLETQDTPKGLVAKFKIADGDEGDTLLAEIDSGERRALSAEVKGVVIRAGKAVAGKLFGAAFVKAGAFPSATLMAADVGDAPDVIDVEGVTYIKAPDEMQPTTETTDATVAPADAAAAADNQEASVTTDSTTAAQDEELTLRASAVPGSNPPKPKGNEGKTLLAALAGKSKEAAGTLLAALDQMTDADLLPAVEKQWLGEIGAKTTYQRRYSPLINSGDLFQGEAIGWRFVAGKSPVVDTYAGFPNQPPTNEVDTESVTVSGARIAGAWSVDRKYIDFPSEAFWQAFFREAGNSYERKADAFALSAMVAGATDVEGGTVPSGVSTAAAYIVDGAMAVLDAERELPTFAIVGTDLYRDLLLTRTDDLIAFLTGALGLEEGSFAGFRIVPSSATALTSKVLVGARNAATQYELPGSPIRVDANAIAVGGMDRALFGYHAELVHDAASLALVAEPTP